MPTYPMQVRIATAENHIGLFLRPTTEAAWFDLVQRNEDGLEIAFARVKFDLFGGLEFLDRLANANLPHKTDNGWINTQTVD